MNNLKKIRKQKGITQKDLAKKYSTAIGRSKPVSGATISQFESSDNLSYNTIKALAQALDVSPYDILSDTANMESNRLVEFGEALSELHNILSKQQEIILTTPQDGLSEEAYQNLKIIRNLGFNAIQRCDDITFAITNDLSFKIKKEIGEQLDNIGALDGDKD